MGVVWPFIIDQRLVHLTPHMFPCHRSHSWISSGDHFLVKNSYVLAFSIIEKVVHGYFRQNGGCVAIDHRPEARTPHSTYVSLPKITFFDFWWRPFLGQKSECVSLRYFENGHSWLFSTKNGGCVAIDLRPEAHTPHYTYVSLP
jgi:hypothetical protein